MSQRCPRKLDHLFDPENWQSVFQSQDLLTHINTNFLSPPEVKLFVWWLCVCARTLTNLMEAGEIEKLK